MFDNAFFIADIALTLFVIYAAFSLPFVIIQLVFESVFLNRARHFSKSIMLLIEGSTQWPRNNGIFTSMLESPMLTQANLISQDQGLPSLIPFRVRRNRSKSVHCIQNIDIKPTRLAHALIYALGMGKARSRSNYNRLLEYINAVKDEFMQIISLLSADFQDKEDLIEYFDQTNASIQKHLDKFLAENRKFSGTAAAIDQDCQEFLYFLKAFFHTTIKDEDCSISYRINKISRLIAAEKAEASLREVLAETLKSSRVSPALHQNLDYIAKLKFDQGKDFEANFDVLDDSLSSWFDQGMELERKVYERKRRAMALLLGFIFAYLMNIDTVYIVSDAPMDGLLRSHTTEYVAELNPTSEDFRYQFKDMREFLESIPLPFGRSEELVEKQLMLENFWGVPFLSRRVLGWLLSGIALSMGASFWFEQIKRVGVR